MKEKAVRFNNDWKGRRIYEENKKKEAENSVKTVKSKRDGNTHGMV